MGGVSWQGDGDFGGIIKYITIYAREYKRRGGFTWRRLVASTEGTMFQEFGEIIEGGCR